MNDNNLLLAVIQYDKEDPRRIHHLLKVYEFAKIIGESENLNPEVLHILEIAAIVHDIGIHVSEQKYGSSAGKYQEIEGPAEARKLLESLKYPVSIVERVCYLVGHHHTYTGIDGLDYQILVEADFLVNLYEDCNDPESMKSAAKAAYTKIFRTETGKLLCRNLYNFQM